MLARQWRRAESAGAACVAQVARIAVVLPEIVVVWTRALDTVVVVSNECWISAEICIALERARIW